jgi:hypothetical protein
MTERDLQTAVFEFFAVALPQDCVAFCVPNGDGRMTRAPGALAGIPDICLIYRGRPIFIELKTKRGAVKMHQRFMHDRLTLSGAVVMVCRSLDEVVDFLAPLVPLRGRVF